MAGSSKRTEKQKPEKGAGKDENSSKKQSRGPKNWKQNQSNKKTVENGDYIPANDQVTVVVTSTPLPAPENTEIKQNGRDSFGKYLSRPPTQCRAAVRKRKLFSKQDLMLSEDSSAVEFAPANIRCPSFVEVYGTSGSNPTEPTGFKAGAKPIAATGAGAGAKPRSRGRKSTVPLDPILEVFNQFYRYFCNPVK